MSSLTRSGGIPSGFVGLLHSVYGREVQLTSSCVGDTLTRLWPSSDVVQITGTLVQSVLRRQPKFLGKRVNMNRTVRLFVLSLLSLLL